MHSYFSSDFNKNSLFLSISVCEQEFHVATIKVGRSERKEDFIRPYTFLISQQEEGGDEKCAPIFFC